MSSTKIVLNEGPSNETCDGAVVKELSSMVKRMKGSFMTEDGGVDYKKLQGSEIFEQYKNLARKLKTLPVESLSESARKALFINLYNCLMIHALIHIKLPDKPIDTEVSISNSLRRFENA